ncbi:MAG: dihydropteroate synthase, partial [Planctomycetota bacterium]|nr:dihydropteroate synthase [Planctomycetota bacterium]
MRDVAPQPLPLGDGCWRGPAPGDASERGALEAHGWRAERALPDGSWAWRRNAAARAECAPFDSAAGIAAELERARVAEAEPYPDQPRWLAVLNLTPDSFSDGGALLTAGGALDEAALLLRATALRAQGAAALDLGAESTRPGAVEIPAAEQLRRLLPAIAALRALGLPLSIDTRSARVAEACLDAGADWINDVSGLEHDPAMAPLAAERGCRVIVMHTRGDPAQMGARAHYRHLLGEIADELTERVRRGLDAGMNREQIVLDPGIGFAKTAAQSRALVA